MVILQSTTRLFVFNYKKYYNNRLVLQSELQTENVYNI